ncbi:MAG TPA: hypothetical protein VN643_02845 [Pyrinomonadaceae bacterium]|nr:hypothetical protein [Pyrinomonadaceae bacterium]
MKINMKAKSVPPAVTGIQLSTTPQIYTDDTDPKEEKLKIGELKYDQLAVRKRVAPD